MKKIPAIILIALIIIGLYFSNRYEKAREEQYKISLIIETGNYCNGLLEYNNSKRFCYCMGMLNMQIKSYFPKEYEEMKYDSLLCDL